MILSPSVQFQGRWDLEGPNRFITQWSGSSLHFQTTSRSVTVELGNLTISRKNYHNVLWRFGDQSVIRTALVKGKRSMVLTPPGTDLGNGEKLREVTLMLCDWGAKLQVLDITTPDGCSICAPDVDLSPTMSMLFIGASLVSGFSPLSRGLVLPHGSYQSFGSVVVQMLRSHRVDARLEMVAYPGMLLVPLRNEQSLEDIFYDGMNGSGGWQHRSKDNPNDIFLCIGTNDQACDVTKDVFLKHYRAFLIRLRDSYPKALRRIHVISPFGVFDHTQPSHRRAVYEPDVQEMVEGLAQLWAASDPNGVQLYHVATDGWIDVSLTCDGLHPTTEGHEKIGSKIVEHLENLGLVECPPPKRALDSHGLRPVDSPRFQIALFPAA